MDRSQIAGNKVENPRKSPLPNSRTLLQASLKKSLEFLSMGNLLEMSIMFADSRVMVANVNQVIELF